MSIKSYIGRRVKPKKGSSENIRVSDYMSTNLTTFKPDQSVMEVMNTLIKKKISGGPVVNEKNELIGIISEGDCMKQISHSRYYNHPMEDIKVGDHMVTDVETIDGEMNVFDAADKFLSSKRRRFPIVKEGKLVGLISQKDVLKAAITLKGHSWK
ncbi:CBS domain-containing protein [Aureisphaera sp. CAU 1614]|uniref:CBS domain-containing protein n=1 Tax=Halomarinibacterium sedimenti TaxID=2857106 RepID=A0A9X1JY34_9FLAO|nr:CBS domain-containing protein [Halomarinibacterium sedimenti]MAL60939.1 inosine-5-monophosphate dehydrogenase [Flavobacteriaceae bacterium]MBW2937142.1 CBS domain-containing protein [Halomarinibacterium sedimenti]HAT67798.1 inosine-5-monophosphate dehydrogenase [Flavobacteriaceae bacterium]|tara:strand:- start:861 stop:1325 length:465 start_codon:yes stop_codon:yes gene_type:complete